MPVVLARQHQGAGRQHEHALGVAQHALAAYPRFGDRQRGDAFDHQQRGEEIQRKVERVIERVDEHERAGGQHQPPADHQGAGALVQIVDTEQQQNQVAHGGAVSMQGCDAT